ncbi:unnamed protein product, partial [Gulo gulo]
MLAVNWLQNSPAGMVCQISFLPEESCSRAAILRRKTTKKSNFGATRPMRCLKPGLHFRRVTSTGKT